MTHRQSLVCGCSRSVGVFSEKVQPFLQIVLTVTCYLDALTLAACTMTHTKWKMLILQTSTHIIQIQKKSDLPLPSQSFLYFPNYAECATTCASKTDYFLLYTDQFKSRLCACQSVTFTLGFWWEACWTTKRRTRPSFAFSRVSFRIFTNPLLFMIPSMLTRFSAADALKHSHRTPTTVWLWVVHLFLLSLNISNVSALEP